MEATRIEENTTDIPYQGESLKEEWNLLSKEGSEILKTFQGNYNAIEFRVDMFLNKLCSVWCKKEFTPNKLVKSYLGTEVPESQYESAKILPENLEFYKDCISRAIGVMRTICDIPIIYTVRTVEDGGFLDTKSSTDFTLYNKLVKYGAEEMCCDFIDIEFQFKENKWGIPDILKSWTNSLVIMSKHFIKHEKLIDYQQLAFSLKVYKKSFDILKIVTSFENLDDFNEAQLVFREGKFTQPIIQVNIGSKLKITRILNKYMLPVSCPEISKLATAPGKI